MNSINNNGSGKQVTGEQVERFIEEVKQLRTLLDEFSGVFLSAKFPYGKPTDRWGRRS
jgi:hypothetical protein